MSRAATMRDGYVMPMVGYGTYLCEADVARTGVMAALAAGYRHIDTAEYYQNEKEVGEGVRASGVPRSEIFVTTKLAPGGFGTPFKTYEMTIQSFEESFNKLSLEYIDLYLIHHAFAKEERLNQWRALVDLQRTNKVRSIGVSNWSERHIEEIKSAGLPLPAVNQIEIHPLCTQSALIAYLNENNILPVAYSSLAPLPQWRSANLGKSSKGEDAPAGKSDEIIEVIAASHNVSTAKVLLRWGLQHGYPVLPKSSNEARIRDNIDIFSFELTIAEMAALDALDENKCFAWPSGNPLYCE